MPYRALCLDGEWTVTGRVPAAVRPPHVPDPVQLQGRVPGQVHIDLEAAGLIADPFWRDQADQCQWVEHGDWSYAREFDLPPGFPVEWTVIEFGGLDTFAHISMNGIEFGHTANMFIPHRFEVGRLLRSGRNAVEVQFTAPERALDGKDMTSFPSCFSTDRVYARKMQCGYGWDWVHRLVTAGIWRSVTLHGYDRARIDDLYVSTPQADARQAEVRVAIACERRTAVPVRARIQILSSDRAVVYESTHDLLDDALQFDVLLASPQLWWPNGYGAQPLYTCAVQLIDAHGGVLDERRAAFGIRTVAIEQIPDAKGSSFTFCVNGTRIFAKGGNWVPADPFPARIAPEHHERLLRLAQEAQINMLRSWGGGIYEPESFWEACDRRGILVIQDFLLACAEYPEQDPEFLDALRVEFAEVIKRMRNHASLVLWSGDNELGMNSDPATQYPGRKIAEEVSGPLCRALDPSRPFLPTSPYAGNPNNSPLAGDCHISAWYDAEFLRSDMRNYQLQIAALNGRLLSESAACGAPPLRSLRKFMTLDDIADPEGRLWEYHTKDNPYNGMDDLTHYRMLERTAQNLYGAPRDLETKVRQMEYVQYEWIRLTLESLRRKKFDCSGVLFWMYNDCWPASGWSVVDYYGFPKAGYYGMKRAFQPVIAASEPLPDGVRVWACSDALAPVQAELTLRFQPWTGPALWTRQMRVEIPANSVLPVAELSHDELSGDGVLVIDLECDRNCDRAVYYLGLPRAMALPKTELQVAHARNGDHGTVTVSSSNYARVVTLDADLEFSDNYFDLLPNESRTITWFDPSGAHCGDIPVTCWNE